jgi:hypothetical protein
MVIFMPHNGGQKNGATANPAEPYLRIWLTI